MAPSQKPHLRAALKGWALVVGIAFAIAVWFLLHYFALGSRPPRWAFGSVPTVPAESTYSTAPVPKGAPRQVELAPVKGARR